MERELSRRTSMVLRPARTQVDSQPLTSRRQSTRNLVLAKIVALAAIASPAVFDATDAGAHPHGVESYRGSASLEVSGGNLILTLTSSTAGSNTTKISLEEVLRAKGIPEKKRREGIRALEGKTLAIANLRMKEISHGLEITFEACIGDDIRVMLGLDSTHITVTNTTRIFTGGARTTGTASSGPRASRPAHIVDEGWTDPVDLAPGSAGGLRLVESGDTGTFYTNNKEAMRTRGYAKGGYDIAPSDPLEITAFGQKNSYIQLVLLPIIDTKLDPKKAADRLTHGVMNFRIYVDDKRAPLHLPTDSDVRYLKPNGSWLTPTKGQVLAVWSAELHLENIRLGPGKHRILVESDDTHSYRVMVLGMPATRETTEDESYMPATIGPFPCEVVYYDGHYNFSDGTRGKKTGGFNPHVDRAPTGTPQDSSVDVYLTREDAAFKPRDEAARTASSTAQGKKGRVVMKTVHKIAPRAEFDGSNAQQCVFVRLEPPARSENSDPRRRNIQVEVRDGGGITGAPEGYVARFYGKLLYVWGKNERGEIEAFKGKVPEDKTPTVRLERY